MTSLFLTISAAVGLVVASAVPARAQSNGWAGAPAAYSTAEYQGPGAGARRVGYDSGYRDGLRAGEQAVRDRRPLDVEHEREYRQADGGYNRNYGDRNRYRDNYRAGFAQGYRDAYSRRDIRPTYPGPGRGYGYGAGREAVNVAFQSGVRDGYSKGLDDVSHHRSSDARRQAWYRSGDRDYNSRYGSRDVYRNEYRRGFEEGYTRAYRERRR
jgi:hypothetical protein